ncbi:hypothetical protein HD598_001732 [Neomicrococcus aestuarii]|uniref:Uncharacterized protein n=1 Tax=Neomicrococcus aestuarii TaxID=556325 RepID=A0A7W8TUC5_9MICC|nr:hypothetical protein [Neomicrococcus aestuarii]MBB5513045.1 hypothetical protein [Neomicrococcus aestuarii]
MILGLIIACELGFWIAILAGLAARYILQAKRLGKTLLLCAPLIDLVLLVAVSVHLGAGATASWHHGLAALYIGFSVTYGHRMIAWADTRFAHRFADGPAPIKVTGRDHTQQCWSDFARTLGAALIAAGILAIITWWVDDPNRTEALTGWYRILGIVVTVEFIWALSYTIWPRKVAVPSGYTPHPSD